MKFELDKILLDDIIFCMEDQEGEYTLDTQEKQVVNLNNYEDQYDEEPDFDDDERFIDLPEWTSSDGYRLMERFAASLKSPVAREELSRALNRSRGVFRAFKDAVEQYPEIEKTWYSFKDREMKEEVIAWYNSLREEWGLEPIGSEPEDNTDLVEEDFIIREGDKSDNANVCELHSECLEALKDDQCAIFYYKKNPVIFPGDISFVAESANGDFAGFINAFSDSSYRLDIRQLEVKDEYRGMGIGKTLLLKLLEKANEQDMVVTIDMPVDAEFFTRTLHLEGFKPCVQRFIFQGADSR